ncbi:YojF family protein [Fredinandcohnia humi]
MKSISKQEVQAELDRLANKSVFIHLETTNGAYAVHSGTRKTSAGAYIRNSLITYSHGKITGEDTFRVGLKLEHGWVYAEGLTDWELDEKGRLLLAGLDEEGRLAVAFQLSTTPF